MLYQYLFRFEGLVTSATAIRLRTRQGHRSELGACLQDDVLVAVVHPRAHAVAAACRHFDAVKLIACLLIDRVKQRRGAVVIEIRVNEQILGCHHGHLVARACVTNIDTLQRWAVADSVWGLTRWNLECNLARVHVICRNCAVRRLEIGNARLKARRTT